MKKVRMFALLVMLVSGAFLFTEQNVAEANYCQPYFKPCGTDLSCCSGVCCYENDTRPECEFHTAPWWNTCG